MDWQRGIFQRSLKDLRALPSSFGADLTWQLSQRLMALSSPRCRIRERGL